jgi:histidine ammonia-lyase
MSEVVLDGGPLSIEDVARVASGELVVVSNSARASAADSRKVLERIEASGAPIYGVNTGFGALRSTRISSEDGIELQRNLVRSHAVGVGEPLDAEEVRAAMLLLAASHLRGASGVGPQAAELICELLNAGVTPFIPCRGSLGASGDLAPLAHLATLLIGDQTPVFLTPDMDDIADSIADAGHQPLTLESKGGLSLINGTHVHTGIAALLVSEAEMIAKACDVACAMNVEAMLCSAQPFRADVHRLRPHPHQMLSAANISRMVEGSALIQSHANCSEVQDAYSLRCSAQVHGSGRQAIAHLRQVAEIELSSVTDNPLVVGDEIVSAGHFHGEPVGLALDYFKIGVAELASISERRSERALNKEASRGLPAFLAENPGLENGMMICQYTAAALVSENKVLAHPSCVDSIPTGANQEDHVSMAMNAALHARQIVRNAANVVAIELLVAAQALDCRKAIQPEAPGLGVRVAWDAIRRQSSRLGSDRSLSEDVQALDVAEVLSAVEDAMGPLQ